MNKRASVLLSPSYVEAIVVAGRNYKEVAKKYVTKKEWLHERARFFSIKYVRIYIQRRRRTRRRQRNGLLLAISINFDGSTRVLRGQLICWRMRYMTNGSPCLETWMSTSTQHKERFLISCFSCVLSR